MIDIEAYRPLATNIFMLMICLVCLKSIIGLHWPWEKCECCDRTWKDIRKEKKNAASKKTQLKDNDQSCILKVWNENISILLPGDLEKKGEKRLLNRSNNNLLMPASHYGVEGDPEHVQIDLRADILVAPHHGSKSSTSFAFLEAVSPQQVIFAVGYLNRFGHPHPLIKDRYEKIHATAFNTALTGAVEYEFRNENKGIHPQLYRNENGHVWNPIK